MELNTPLKTTPRATRQPDIFITGIQVALRRATSSSDLIQPQVFLRARPCFMFLSKSNFIVAEKSWPEQADNWTAKRTTMVYAYLSVLPTSPVFLYAM